MSDNLQKLARFVPDNPYFLLTPGPLSTSKEVRAALLYDMCTWDNDFTSLTQKVRAEICALMGQGAANYTCVLMQGSGTFSVEAVIGTLPAKAKLLILANGHYGLRMAKIAACLKIEHTLVDFGEDKPVNLGQIEEILKNDPALTHVAMVHVETSTGILNPARAVGEKVKKAGKTYILDAMSSFGGLADDFSQIQADFVIASSNKCLQGIPGIGYILAKPQTLENCKSNARSLSLDLYAQWREMEDKQGKWRYTAPTHVLRALDVALTQLKEEGGPKARHARLQKNQKLLVKGMRELGFETLLPDELHSPIITTFYYHQQPGFTFEKFYNALKKRGFIIYPGKITHANTFRLGNIGQVYEKDIQALLVAVAEAMLEIRQS